MATQVRENLEETTFSLSREVPRPAERRKNERTITILRVGSLIIAGQRELCLIRNISAGGLMAHAYSELAEGQEVLVELQTNRPIPARVIWTEGNNAGIEFARPIDIEEMLSSTRSLPNGWQPRPPRVEVDRLGELRVGASIYPVNTSDISQGGAGLELDQTIEPGTPVVLTLEKFRPVHGVVRWCREGSAGISFNQVIPFAELMGWLRDG